MDDWCPHLKEVNSLCLFVSAYAESRLKFLDSTIRVSFDFEGPHGWENFHAAIARDELPTFEFVGQGVEFFLHGVVELLLMWSAHGHFERWIVLIVFE